MLQRDPETCPDCQGDSKVIDTRPRHQARYRRRECLICGRRWNTWETTEPPSSVAVPITFPAD